MILINKTTGESVTRNLKIADTISENIFGLIKEKQNTSMLFNTRFGIHTFFMKHSITVLVLSKKNKIVKIKQNLKPNKLFLWHPKYAKIIELPNPQTNCKIGDILLFES